MARLSEFTQDKANRICEAISSSAFGIRKICKDNDVSVGTWMRWLDERKELQEQYARAKEAQADSIFWEILEIADTPLIGEKIKTSGSGEDEKTEITTGDTVERSKLKVDARKWVVARLAPKKYGEFSRNEITGPNGGGLQILISNADAEA